MASKILVVEDDPEVRELIMTGLALSGYEGIATGNGLEGVELAKAHKPDLVILDLMLPDLDGFEVCKRIKADEATKATPVIIITARVGVANVVKGLEGGAIDYVTKPFEVMELMARIRAQLRLQDEVKAPPKVLRRDGLVLDSYKRTIEFNGRAVKNLTEKEFAICFQLIRHSPRVLDRKEIFESVWGRAFNSKSRNIDVHIKSIREKIGLDLARRLVSVKGQGYKFV
jgi:two-component system, OmpR family, alkaline phosphatase synthesis response regulator PhoP